MREYAKGWSLCVSARSEITTMADPVTLYSTKEPVEGSVTNEALKKTVSEIIEKMGLGKEKPEGSKVKGVVELKFDKTARAFQLVSDGVTKKDMTALLKQTAFARTPEAESAWASDIQARDAKADLVRDAARDRTSTTQEKGPAVERARTEQAQIDAGATRHVMYRTPDEKGEMLDLLKQIDAKSHYHPNAKAENGDKHPHFSVVTAAPGVEDMFKKFMGPEARERMYAYGRENGKGEAVNTAKETLRETAKKGGAFMANFARQGLALYKDVGETWIGKADNATVAQLTSVRQITARSLAASIDKEFARRSETSGMSVEQLKEIAASKGKAELSKHGTGLQGAELGTKNALEKGLAALDKYLEGRGVVPKSVRQEAAQEVKQEVPAAERSQAPARSAAKGRDVSSEDAAADAVSAMANRRRGSSRG